MDSRRRFLQLALASGFTAYVDKLYGDSKILQSLLPTRKSIVSMVLNGGVDPFFILEPTDTVVQNILQKSRPQLMLSNTESFGGQTSFKINSRLKNIAKVYNLGGACIFMGADSVNRSLSHFEQLHYLSNGGDISATTGYLGRCLSELSLGANDIGAVNMGFAAHQRLKGDGYVLPGSALIQDFKKTLEILSGPRSVLEGQCNGGQTNQSILKLCDLRDQTLRHREFFIEVEKMQIRYPMAQKYELVKWFELTEKSLRAQKSIPIVSIDVDGWDTHSAQNSQLYEKFSEVDAAVGQFYDNFLSKSEGQDSLLIISSEFGRTVQQNSSLGTEHGVGGIVMIFGHPLRFRGQRIFSPTKENLLKGNFINTQYSIFEILSEVMKTSFNLSSSQIAKIFPQQSTKEIRFLKS